MSLADTSRSRRTVNRLFWFFQAEDGIRYLVRSRGLGDVYKRQAQRAGRDGAADRGLRLPDLAHHPGPAHLRPGRQLSLIHI